MGQSADGNKVDARLRDSSHRAQRDASRDLQQRATLWSHGTGPTDVFQRHIVKQDRVGAAGKRLLELGDRLTFDLHADGVWSEPPYALERLADRTSRRDMILLDQDTA